MTDIWTKQVTDASEWTPDDLEADRSWEYELTRQQAQQCRAAVSAVESTGLQLVEIRTRDFPVTGLETLLKNLGLQIRHGRGMAVLRGIPVGDFDLPQIEKLYWGLLIHLGTGITQNSDAGLIHYVTDGSLRPN